MIMSSGLLIDFYELTMAAVYYRFKSGVKATFDLFVRQLPKNRSFLVACGIEDVLSYLKNFSFSDDDLKYLSRFNFKRDFLKFLGKLRFKGDIWAVKEGTLVFPEEPILRITASLIEVQLLESYLLNAINLQTTIASKAIRVVMAAKDKPVFDFSLRRTQGIDASLKAARTSYIAGCDGTSNVLAGKLYGIKVVGTMAHSFVMSFENELEGFRAYVDSFPDESILLLDTYSYSEGMKNAVIAARELKQKGHNLIGVRLDSGDLAKESRRIRAYLDKNGLSFVKIFASGNLDEYKIEKLLRQKAPIDSFGVGTNMGVSVDAPYCDVIYKISEVTGKSGNFLPTMKLSPRKKTFPGRKQAYRIKDKKGRFVKDIVALDKEKIKGEPLLVEMMKNGKLVYSQSGLKEKRDFVKEQMDCLPDRYKVLIPKAEYPAIKSVNLRELIHNVGERIKGNN